MTLGEEAKKWFIENEAPGGFSAALLRCFFYGCVVIKPPHYVILAEAVLTDGNTIVAVGPDCPKNCWWIWYVSAPPGTATPLDFLYEAPYLYRFIGFKRRGKIRVYQSDKLRKDIHGRSSQCTSAATA